MNTADVVHVRGTDTEGLATDTREAWSWGVDGCVGLEGAGTNNNKIEKKL